MRFLKLNLILGLLFLTISSSANIKIIDLPIKDFAYSKKSNKIYGVIGCMHRQYGNCLVQLNSVTGEVEKFVFVGSNPNKVKLTTNENYAFVAFEGIAYIKRINLNDFIVDQEIFLGPAEGNSTTLPNDFVIIPNTNNTIVVCRHLQYAIADFIDLVMFKDGILQPRTVPRWITATNRPKMSKIVSNNDGTRLYGYGSETTSGDFYLINVHEDGVSHQETFPDLISAFCSIKSKNDTIYARNGEVIIGFPDNPQKIRYEHLYSGNYDYGQHYGYTYSEIHKSFIYQRTDYTSLYFNFYSGQNFENVDSIYINIPSEMESLWYMVSNLAVLDEKRFVFSLETVNEAHVLIIASTELSNDATLKELSPYRLEMTPKFSPEIFNYDVYSPDAWFTCIDAVPSHGMATVEYAKCYTPPDIAHIEVTAQDGITKQSYYLNFNVFTSFEFLENKQQNQTVYPNPTSGIVYINEIENILRIEVYSNHGVLIKEFEKNQLSGYLDFTNEQVGIYNLRIELKDGTLITKRIVKI